MSAAVDWPGYDSLIRRLSRAAHITFPMVQPLLETWERILVEGNRRKVLAGLQGSGLPMPPVTYRNGFAIRSRPRRGRNFGVAKFAAKGKGFRRIAGGQRGAHGNLTTAEYKKLTGPPLAPRGERSRVIANLETAIGQDGRTFYAVKSWREVVSIKGKPFLMAHFKGRGRLPVRDLRGTDPEERRLAGAATRHWGELVLAGKIPG